MAETLGAFVAAAYPLHGRLAGRTSQDSLLSQGHTPAPEGM